MIDLTQTHFKQNEIKEFLENKNYIPKYCTAIFLDEKEKCEKKDIKDLSVDELKTICAKIMEDLRGNWGYDYESRIEWLLDYLKELIKKDNINSDKYTPYIETCKEELRGETYPDGRIFRDTIRGEGLYDYEGKLTLQPLYHLIDIIVNDDFFCEVLFFIEKLTPDNIEEINKIAEVFKKEYPWRNIEWIGVFTHHCECVKTQNVDKIITTNATRFLDPQETEHLKVIDCKEIFKKNK